MKRRIALLALGAATLSGAARAGSRDYIYIAGSSTVYPFATVVAEHFGKATRFKTPRIESTGSGGGMKLFCEGVGVKHPDITNASRRIKKSEYDRCRANGVKGIVEVKIGYDGIVIANSRQAPASNSAAGTSSWPWPDRCRIPRPPKAAGWWPTPTGPGTR